MRSSCGRPQQVQAHRGAASSDRSALLPRRGPACGSNFGLSTATAHLTSPTCTLNATTSTTTTTTTTTSSTSCGAWRRPSSGTSPPAPCRIGTVHQRLFRAAGSTSRSAAAASSSSSSSSSSPSSSPSSSSSSSSTVVDDTARVEEPSTALLLAWFACANRSLFALQCLVEAVVELYREGRSFEELQLSLKVATQGGSRAARGGSGAEGAAGAAAAAAAAAVGEDGEAEAVVLLPILQQQEEDVLMSWMALVFLTLEDLGVPRDKEPSSQEGGAAAAAAASRAAAGQDGMAGGSPYLRGMLGYVRQTLGMYDEGQTLARVAGLQGLVQQASSAATSPFLLLMQQYTRLVLLTVEVVAAAGLPTSRPLLPPDVVTRSSGYASAFAGSCSAANLDLDLDLGRQQQQQGVCPPRGLSVRLMMAFMGAVLGSRWSLDKFVEGVRVAYDQGVAADELFSQLEEQEFAQTGGLLPIATSAPASSPTPSELASDALADPTTTAAAASDAAPAPASSAAAAPAPAPGPAPGPTVTKTLLSSWISLSYMTLAQLAVPYPAAGQRLGWAWAGFGDPIEAIGMNDFVGNVLRQMAGADPRAVPAPPQPEAGGEAVARWSEPEAGAGAPRRGSDAVMVRVEDDMLPNTSTAFRVLSQQVALVQAVCRDVMG